MAKRLTDDEARHIIRERMQRWTDAMCEDIAIPFAVVGGFNGEPFVLTIAGATDEALVGVLEAAIIGIKNKPRGEHGGNGDGPAIV